MSENNQDNKIMDMTGANIPPHSLILAMIVKDGSMLYGSNMEYFDKVSWNVRVEIRVEVGVEARVDIVIMI